MNRRTLIAAAVAAGLATLAPAAAQAQEITLTLHHALSPKSTAHANMLVPWAAAIEAASEGRVKIEIYPSMTLGGGPAQLFRQVADGVVDLTWTVNGWTPGLFPRAEVFELPTVFTNDIAATNLAMADLYEEWLAPDFDDVHVLFLHVHAGNAITTATKEVRAPSDLDGLKIRTPGAAQSAVIAAMGATPVTMPVPDLPQSLSTGAVDGALIPYEIMTPLQLPAVTKYHVNGPDDARFGTTTFQVSMNLDRWNALPDDIKAIFTRESGPERLRAVAAAWREADDIAIAAATAAGNEHIVLTPDEMAAFDARMSGVVDAWIAAHPEFDGRALVEAARAAIKAHAGGGA